MTEHDVYLSKNRDIDIRVEARPRTPDAFYLASGTNEDARCHVRVERGGVIYLGDETTPTTDVERIGAAVLAWAAEACPALEKAGV